MVQFQKLNELREGSRALILLAICAIYLVTIALLSTGLYGDADSITHYYFARYAFKYPYHFVDHWAKPLFTTLAAPFAQFGLSGVIFFNIFCGLLTAWLVYRIARHLNYRYALLAIPFSLLAPIYMTNLFTSLTEPLFALVLVAAIYFFLEEKSITSAIIISLIPYARTEGVMFLVIFAIAFILVKNYRAIPFLFAGFILFSAAGYFHYGNFFWFFTAMPYSEKGSQLYGHGSFWNYFERLPEIMGIPLIVLAGVGLIFLAAGLFRDKKPSLSYEWITEYLLLTGSFLAFLLAHSFLWWKGMMGVLASDRFMVCIMPLGGFLALVGLSYLLSFTGQVKWIKMIMILLITGLVAWTPYYYHKIPAGLSGQNLVMHNMADRLKKLNYKEKLLLYFDPKLAFYLDEDPFENPVLYPPLPGGMKPELFMADSSYMAWDTQFGEYENRLSLDDMINNHHFRIIDGFFPDKEFRFSNGQNYLSMIFQKVPEKEIQNHWIPIIAIDFESAVPEVISKYITDSIAFAGQRSMRVNHECEYGYSLEEKIPEILPVDKVIIRGRAKLLRPEKVLPERIVLVISVQSEKGKISRYLAKSGSYYSPEPGTWFEISIVTPVLRDIPKNSTLKLYTWYQGEEAIFMDDLILEYIPVSE